MAETQIIISADASQAQGALRSLEGSLDSVSGRLMNLSSMAGTLAGALSLTAFATAIKGSIDLADSLNDLAKKTGASVETLAGLQLAAAQSGTSLEAIANGSKKLAVSMVENESVFKSLGINTKDQTEALIQLGDVFAGMDDPVKRSALAVKIFGKAGDEMLPMLMEGSAGIRKMIERGQELSPITTEMARQADKFNDSMAEFALRAKASSVSMAAELLPVLNETLDAFNEWNKSGGSTVEIGKGIAEVFKTIVVLGANVAYVFKQTGNEIGGMVAQFQALGEGGGIFSQEGRDAWSRVGQMMKDDAAQARKDIDAFSERIMNAGKTPAQAPADTPKDSRGSSLLASLSKQGVDDNDKLREKDLAGWVKYADAVLAEGERIDEIIRKQQEAQNAAEEKKVNTAIEAFTKQNQTLAEMVAQQDLTEAERIQYKYDAEQQRLEEQRIALQEHGAWTLEYEAQFETARLNNQARANAAFIKLEEQTARQKQQVLVSSLSTISSLMSSNNETAFRIGQAAAIANATISTYEGAMKAIGQLGVWGIPVAAGIVAAGLMQVNNIASTQIGGGTPSPVNATFSGGSVASGSDPAPITATSQLPNSTIEQSRQQITLKFEGSGRYTYDEVVNGILPLINQAGDNGADIMVLQG